MLKYCETSLTQLPELLEILLAHLPDELRLPRIEQTASLYQQELGELAVLGTQSQSKNLAEQQAERTRHEVFHFERNGEMIGGCFSMLRPDGTVIAIQPAALPSEPESSLRLIYETLFEYAVESRARLVMLLVDYQQSADETQLDTFGFQKVSDLLNLNAERAFFPKECPAKRLRFVTYNNEQWSEMVALVEKTYKNTLDFPLLTGIIPTEQILRGYQESHIFEPTLWFFIEYQPEIIGALLLTQIENTTHLELTYVGLVQQFRGLGFSREIVHFSQFVASKRDCSHLLVSVDAGNTPALNAYLHNDFHLHDQKEIFVRFL